MRTNIILTAALLTASLALPGCNSEKPLAAPLTPVRVQTVQLKDAQTGLRYTANIEANHTVTLAFQVGGYVKSILQQTGADGKPREIQSGDPVSKGTVLAKIDKQPYQDKVEEAKSQLDEARAALRKAQADFRRANALFKSQSMTAPEFDSYKKELQTTEAAVAGAKAQLDQAVVELGYCKLTSPLDGVVLQRNIEVGTLVGAGTVSFTIADIRSVKAMFGVPESVVRNVQEGSPMSIALPSEPERKFAGRITSIAASADSSTRVFQVEVTVPNEEKILKPGMVATLSLTKGGGRTGALAVVPLAAIVRSKNDPEGYAVYRVNSEGSEATVHLQDVQVGPILGNSAAITAGLKAGDQVVVFGVTLVTDGAKVSVIP